MSMPEWANFLLVALMFAIPVVLFVAAISDHGREDGR